MHYIELGILPIELIKHQVIPLQKSAKLSQLVCSFKYGFIILMSNCARFFLIWLLNGALYNMIQLSKYSICFLYAVLVMI